jgi:hypothetical protein
MSADGTNRRRVTGDHMFTAGWDWGRRPSQSRLDLHAKLERVGPM